MKKISIEGQTEHGGCWRIQAAMEGDGLGVIQLEDLAMTVADTEKLADALRHTATSIAWIQAHGLEPTFAEPPP